MAPPPPLMSTTAGYVITVGVAVILTLIGVCWRQMSAAIKELREWADRNFADSERRQEAQMNALTTLSLSQATTMQHMTDLSPRIEDSGSSLSRLEAAQAELARSVAVLQDWRRLHEQDAIRRDEQIERIRTAENRSDVPELRLAARRPGMTPDGRIG